MAESMSRRAEAAREPPAPPDDCRGLPGAATKFTGRTCARKCARRARRESANLWRRSERRSIRMQSLQATRLRCDHHEISEREREAFSLPRRRTDYSGVNIRVAGCSGTIQIPESLSAIIRLYPVVVQITPGCSSTAIGWIRVALEQKIKKRKKRKSESVDAEIDSYCPG